MEYFDSRKYDIAKLKEQVENMYKATEEDLDSDELNDDIDWEQKINLRKKKTELMRQMTVVPKENEIKGLQIKRQLTSAKSKDKLSQRQLIEK